MTQDTGPLKVTYKSRDGGMGRSAREGARRCSNFKIFECYPKILIALGGISERLAFGGPCPVPGTLPDEAQ